MGENRKAIRTIEKIKVDLMNQIVEYIINKYCTMVIFISNTRANTESFDNSVDSMK